LDCHAVCGADLDSLSSDECGIAGPGRPRQSLRAFLASEPKAETIAWVRRLSLSSPRLGRVRREQLIGSK
jgi:hypothetical protein